MSIEPPGHRAWMDAVLGSIAKDLGLPWPRKYAITRAPAIDPVRAPITPHWQDTEEAKGHE
jgi:hypothetical protein